MNGQLHAAFILEKYNLCSTSGYKLRNVIIEYMQGKWS
jgi:hypothetical protein